MSVETLTRDNLIAGEKPIVTEEKTIVSGAGAVARATVVGKITLGAASKANGGAGEAGANTGNGTLTLDVTTPIRAKAKVGVYRVKVIRAAIAEIGTTPAVPAQNALAVLKDPDGNTLETFEVPTTPGVTIDNQVKFVMLDGSTAFVAGDGFTITIAAGSGKFKTVNSANVDGSQYPYGIVAETVDATSADKITPLYLTGEFNASSLIFGGSDTYATHKEALAERGIFIKNGL